MSWKVAVIGASGQIGSALCRELVRQGYEVNALVRNDCPAINGLPLKVCSGNVLDKDSLIRLMDECNVVIIRQLTSSLVIVSASHFIM